MSLGLNEWTKCYMSMQDIYYNLITRILTSSQMHMGIIICRHILISIRCNHMSRNNLPRVFICLHILISKISTKMGFPWKSQHNFYLVFWNISNMMHLEYVSCWVYVMFRINSEKQRMVNDYIKGMGMGRRVCLLRFECTWCHTIPCVLSNFR